MKLWGVTDAACPCQACRLAPAMDRDVLCAGCAGTVQLSWGLYASREPLRNPGRWSTVCWDGRRREVCTVATAGEYL